MGCGASSSKVNVHAQPDERTTAVQRLQFAIDAGNDPAILLTTVKSILSEMQIAVDSPCIELEMGMFLPPVMYAARKDRVELVQYLLSVGATVTPEEIEAFPLPDRIVPVLNGAISPFLPWQDVTASVDTAISATSDGPEEQSLYDLDIPLGDIEVEASCDLTVSEELAAGVGEFGNLGNSSPTAVRGAPLDAVEEEGVGSPSSLADADNLDTSSVDELLQLQAQAQAALAALAGLTTSVNGEIAELEGGGGGTETTEESLQSAFAQVEAFQAEAREGLAALQKLKGAPQPQPQPVCA